MREKVSERKRKETRENQEKPRNPSQQLQSFYILYGICLLIYVYSQHYPSKISNNCRFYHPKSKISSQPFSPNFNWKWVIPKSQKFHSLFLVIFPGFLPFTINWDELLLFDWLRWRLLIYKFLNSQSCVDRILNYAIFCSKEGVEFNIPIFGWSSFRSRVAANDFGGHFSTSGAGTEFAAVSSFVRSSHAGKVAPVKSTMPKSLPVQQSGVSTFLHLSSYIPKEIVICSQSTSLYTLHVCSLFSPLIIVSSSVWTRFSFGIYKL